MERLDAIQRIHRICEGYHLFLHNGKWFLFGNLTNRIWELEENEVEQFRLWMATCSDNHSHEEISVDDIYGEFFRYLSDDLEKHTQHSLPDKPLNSLVLLVSEECNFSCTYCYGSYGVKSGRMTFETAKNAVDLAIECNIRDIVFFGGEPLTNFELIREVVRYVEDEKKIETTFRMTTNASLVREEYLLFLKEHNFEVSVSMDGDRLSHNQTRVYPDGSDTYDDVLQGIALLKQFDLLSLLEITYSARHTDLNKQIRAALDLHSVISCACVDGKRHCRHEQDVIRGEKLLDFYKQLLNYEEHMLDSGEQILGARELYDSICNGKAFQTPKYLCSDIETRIVVAADGTASPCPEMHSNAEYIICNFQLPISREEFLRRRQKTLDKLTSDRIQKEWFSGLCETCIQHVDKLPEDERFIYSEPEAFSMCMEGLLKRFLDENTCTN